MVGAGPTKASVVALRQLERMSIFGDAVHVIGGGGVICHLRRYGRHNRLKASVVAVNPERHRNIVNRNT